ncbi:MAG: hypothetical protein ACREME_09265 [Gemmatimonadales bacterium]
MRRWFTILLGSALCAFGGVAGATVPGNAFDGSDCGDLGDLICRYEEETGCEVLALCPFGSQGYFLCCVRERTDREYHYWNEAPS